MSERNGNAKVTSTKRGTLMLAALVVVALAGAFVAGRYSGRVGDVPGSPQGDVRHENNDERSPTEGTCGTENARLRQQVSQLEQQAKTAETRAKLQATLAGARPAPEDFDIDPNAPVTWPEDTPEIFREAGFRRVVTEMVKQAGPPVELLDVDCTEAPCYAALRAKPGRYSCLEMMGLPAWQEVYESGCSTGNYIRTCDDGSQDTVCIMAKCWEGWSDRTNKHIEERDNARADKLLDAWTCGHEKK